MEKRVAKYNPSANIKYAAMIFVVTLVVLVLAYLYFSNVRKSFERKELHHIAENTASKVTKVIAARIWKFSALAALIVQHNGEFDDFDIISSVLIDDPVIRNVSLAPNGVVSRVFPMEGNEGIIGLDYLGSGGSDEARAAVESGEMTLAGPFDLIQGVQGVAARIPVYLNRGGKKDFWGFIGVALRWPEALDAAFLDELYQHGYEGEIWRINPATGKKQIIWQSSERTLANPESEEIRLFNVTWNVSVSRVSGADAYVEILASVLAIFFISALVAILGFHYLEVRQMKQVMEEMALADPLTKLPNRRALLLELPKIVSASKTNAVPFAIVYLDVNDLKRVNETLGRRGGDRMLDDFAHILLAAVGDRGLTTRVGGDEFALILEGMGPGKELDAFVEELREKTTFVFSESENADEDLSCPVSACFGTATFPDDGEDPEELLHLADKRLHLAKVQYNQFSAVRFKSTFR